MSVVAEKVENNHVVPGAEVESAWLAPRDFKSLVSTSFTIRALDRIGNIFMECDAVPVMPS